MCRAKLVGGFNVRVQGHQENANRIDRIDAPAVPSWGRVGVLPVERRAQTETSNGRTGTSSELEISCGGASSFGGCVVGCCCCVYDG